MENEEMKGVAKCHVFECPDHYIDWR